MGVDKIGTFRGVPVYRVSLSEYINSGYHRNDDNMYLIKEDLIYKNEIIGTYDGEYVHENDIPTTFYHEIEHPVNARTRGGKVAPKVKTVEVTRAETAPTSSIEAKTADDILAGVYAWRVE